MLNEKNFGSREEQLRMENELLKIKLMFEHGADFHYHTTSNELPPEVEFQFLQNIAAFEKASQEAAQVTVYEFIGKPAFKVLKEIPGYAFKKAFHDLMATLNANQINVESLCEVPDMELYRFITEELFMHPMEQLKIPGWMIHYIYEDFHPNHEFDIKNSCADFILTFLDKDSGCFMDPLSCDAPTTKFLKQFRDSYESFDLGYFRIDEVTIQEEKASVKYRLSFTAVIEGSRDKQVFEGSGSMELDYLFDWWTVSKVRLPK